MDTSFWIKLIPTLQFVETRALLHNRYLYKLQIFAPGIRTYFYYKSKSNFSKETTKKYFDTHVRQGVIRLAKSAIDFDQLDFIYDFVTERKLKTRIEGVWITFYSESLNPFVELANEMKKFGLGSRVQKLFGPKTELIDNFNRGEILVKRVPEMYQYKIVLNCSKSHKTYHARQQIADYLTNLGDKVSYTNNFMPYLIGNKWSTGKLSFYASEEHIYTFIKLISPDLVNGIFKLVRL